MSLPSPRWHLKRFLENLDVWEAMERPDEDLRLTVTSWIFSRHDDPFADVQREPGFDTLWSGAIPGTHIGDSVVVCSYFVETVPRLVICTGLASLSWPA